MIAADGTAQQGQARRQRDPGRQPGRGQGRRRGPRPAPLPLHRRRQRPRAARADGQHHQRRQARRQQDRLPGIHGHARGGQDVRRRHPHGGRGLPQPQGVLKKAGHNTNVGDEGGFAPNLDNEEAIKFILDAVAKAGYQPGRDKDFAIALDSACSELFDEGGKKGYKFWKSAPRQALQQPARWSSCSPPGSTSTR